MEGLTGSKTESYDRYWQEWDAMVDASPAPAFRRRKVIRWVSNLPNLTTVLDVGCGNGRLLQEASRALPGLILAGVDVSPAALSATRQRVPYAILEQMDIEQRPLPQKFDLVICMEVVEHCLDYQAAIRHLAGMTKRWLLLTVPCGPLFHIDRRMGHHHHFTKGDMSQIMTEQGLVVRKVQSWGFPFFNLYKRTINSLPNFFSKSFLCREEYGIGKRVLSDIVRCAFGLCLPCWGYQLFLLAEKRT